MRECKDKTRDKHLYYIDNTRQETIEATNILVLDPSQAKCNIQVQIPISNFRPSMNQKTREARSDLAYRENEFAEVLCAPAKVDI